jgi:hypothetical protein
MLSSIRTTVGEKAKILMADEGQRPEFDDEVAIERKRERDHNLVEYLASAE